MTKENAAESVFHGCIPAVMTPCDEHGKICFDTLVVVSDKLIKTGMRAVVSVGSMGNWVDVSFKDRLTCVEVHVDAGIPVIVGTGAQSTRDAVEIAKHAADYGASGLMIIPKQLYRVGSRDAQFHHFSEVLKAGEGLPAVVYNSPYYGYQMEADQFFELAAKFPNLVGFKEFGGADALTRDAQNITSGNKKFSLLVGVDTQVYHGYVNCGAVGAITGIGNVLPVPVLRLIKLCKEAAKGDPVADKQARELNLALYELSKFDEGIDLVLYYKYLMWCRGGFHYLYQHQINGSDCLSEAQQAFARAAMRRFENWWEQSGNTRTSLL